MSRALAWTVREMKEDAARRPREVDGEQAAVEAAQSIDRILTELRSALNVGDYNVAYARLQALYIVLGRKW